MLRIYDESELRKRLALRWFQVLVLLVAGVGIGAAWTSGGNHPKLLSQAFAAKEPLARFTSGVAAPGCVSPVGTRLQLDCQLHLPELAHAEGI